jgi:ribosomal protein L11
MGRLAVAFTLVMIAVATGDARPASPVAARLARPQPVIKTFTGIVESVTLSDPEREIRSEIVATNDKGRNSSFLVTVTTTIYDLTWKALALKQIHRGDGVKIHYVTTADGLNVSRSIHLTGQSPPPIVAGGPL